MNLLLPTDVGDVRGCCGDGALYQFHRVARRMDRAFSCQALRADGIVQENGEDAFVDEELAIAAILAGAWGTAAAIALKALMAAIAGGYSPSSLREAIDQVTAMMARLFDDVSDDVRAAVRRVINAGTAAGGVTLSAVTASQVIDTTFSPLPNPFGGVSGGTLFPEARAVGVVGSNAPVIPELASPSAATFEAGIVNALRYSTNAYFNTQVVPALLQSIDGVTQGIAAPSIAEIQAAIARHFRTVPYWGLVANVAASRGYHYGLLSAYQARGIVAYRFRAIIDERTSEICAFMNGREFLVADALSVLDALASDQDPLAAKTRTPWVRASAVQGLSNRDLAARGVLIPPLHAFCRSTIFPVYA